MRVFAFGYRIGKRGVAVHKLESIFGELTQVITNGFVGAMDSSIKRRIIDVDPIGFIDILAGFDYCVFREGEGVGIVEC